MVQNVQIIIIIAAVLIVLVILILYRQRLGRIGFKAGSEGVEVEAEMADTRSAGKESAANSTADVARIRQKGKRDEIKITAKKVKAKDVTQEGDENKINIGG